MNLPPAGSLANLQRHDQLSSSVDWQIHNSKYQLYSDMHLTTNYCSTNLLIVKVHVENKQSNSKILMCNVIVKDHLIVN